MIQVEDQKLVHDFLRTRSESAFLNLYRSKTPHLYRMALRLTQDEYQSEELLQEVWIIAIGKLEKFEWRSELKTWLIGILINLARAKRKEREKELVGEQEDIAAGMSEEMSFTNSYDLEKAIATLHRDIGKASSCMILKATSTERLRNCLT